MGIAVAGCWLAWNIVVHAVSDYYVFARPDIALAFDSEHAAALRQVAEQKLSDIADEEQRRELAELAERALINEPLNPAPLRVLALVTEEEGDDPRAESLMKLAAGRALRDEKAQIWLADYHLLAGDFHQAMEHIDALLRVWPNLGETLFPVLAELTGEAESAEAVVSTLRSVPPWRQSFLAVLPKVFADPAALSEFYGQMSDGHSSLTAHELRPYLETLIDQGEASLAYAAWQASLPPKSRAEQPGDLYNGAFDQEPSDSPFDWTLGRVKGAQADLTLDEKGGNSLRVQFYNARVPFRHVSQVLVLSPGSYQLSGEVKAENLQNPRGLQWKIYCAVDGKDHLGETERTLGTAPWTHFEMHFNVPSRDDCGAQLLRLELAARIPAEQQISGEIWFDDLRIDPVTDTTR